jgi:hypothetical protein
MPTFRSTFRCDSFKPLVVLKVTITAPTLKESAAPASCDCNVGLKVAADEATLIAKTENSMANVAKTLRNIPSVLSRSG